MKKAKKKFLIYQHHDLDYGDGRRDEYTEFIGETWAVSEPQAINNICYRYGIKAFDVHEWAGDGARTSSLYAEEK